MKAIAKYSAETFESIKRHGKHGREFWYARELQEVLEYSEWRNFEEVIKKAMKACVESNILVTDHFVGVNKMVRIGSEAEREIRDFMLSRYACYLIVQNGDPSKKIIALGQTYFAVMTRTQEKTQESFEILEEKSRLAIRKQLAEHNKSLAITAKSAGVQETKDFAIFQNKGYEGLYGGLNMQDIHIKKRLKKSQKILDHMGSTELAANLFRATQTEEKIKRENIYGKEKANRAHFDIGAKVRLTIKEMGGTMPENLETPNKSIQQIERKQNKILVHAEEG